ncbi:MAG: hypothetical protein WCO56_06425 [Verrucomicrobiota bacterium]
MKYCHHHRVSAAAAIFQAVLLGWLTACVPCRAAEKLPAVKEILNRMIERASAIARAERGPQYTYDKHALREQLDENGETIKSEERFYQVRLVAGFPFDRLVKIQGRELTSDELKQERQKEEKFQQKVSARNLKKMAAKKEGWVTAQLLERYQFTVKERVILNNRPTLVLTFKPREGELPTKNFMDNILNQVSGTTWVDEEDADAAKLTSTLQGSVSLGLFGVLGSLNQCEFCLERQRMPDGTWVNVRQVVQINCRKLASTMRFRNTEKSSGFKLDSAASK